MSANPSRKTLNPIVGLGKSGRGGYNNTKLMTDPTSMLSRDVKCKQVPYPTSLRLQLNQDVANVLYPL